MPRGQGGGKEGARSGQGGGKKGARSGQGGGKEGVRRGLMYYIICRCKGGPEGRDGR